jgi:hypothetical protein
LEHPADTIKRIADIAEAVGAQSGTGGCEMAGAIISYFAAHPDKVCDLFENGLVDTLGRDDLWANGRLTFHRQLDGAVTTPQDLRIAKTVRAISKPIP